MVIMKRVTLLGASGKIVISVAGYERAAPLDPDDASWLSAEVEVQAGPFTGSYNAALTVQDLAAFAAELAPSLAKLAGRSTFAALEGWLHFTVDIGVRGNAKVFGTAVADNGGKAELAFEFESDQASLAETLRDLQSVIATYPAST